MAKRKKAHHEEEMGEAWLLPYSDLMTLLLAVFIVLYAVSQLDAVSIADLADSFRKEFGTGTNFIIGESSTTHAVQETISIDPNAPLIDILADFPRRPERGEGEKHDQLDSFAEALRTYFAQNDMVNEFDISDQPSMLTLVLGSDVLFPLGSARLNDSQKEMAKSLAEIVYETQQQGVMLRIQVSGHTDNIPISTAQYSSNWNLSLDRAANFMAAMIDGSQLDPRVFSAVGHGEMDPVDTNETDEGRQRNRRVEVQFMFEENAMRTIDGLLRTGGQ